MGELEKYKRNFCLGYNHLDLSSTNIRNVAVHYLKNDISYDISIQQVAMDVFGKKKEWVAVVNLNTQDKNGYLQSELPRCERANYLVGANVKVKAYVDNNNCCQGGVDFEECKKKAGCEPEELKDKEKRHYAKEVVLTGTSYEVTNTHVSRRRRLLNGANAEGC